jgi:hypothetical protein
MSSKINLQSLEDEDLEFATCFSNSTSKLCTKSFEPTNERGAQRLSIELAFKILKL